MAQYPAEGPHPQPRSGCDGRGEERKALTPSPAPDATGEGRKASQCGMATLTNEPSALTPGPSRIAMGEGGAGSAEDGLGVRAGLNQPSAPRAIVPINSVT